VVSPRSFSRFCGRRVNRLKFVTAEDPVGSYSISVESGGLSLASFDFEVTEPLAGFVGSQPQVSSDVTNRRLATETASGGDADLTGRCLQSARRDGAASIRCNPKPTWSRSVPKLRRLKTSMESAGWTAVRPA
jgi:hypothetical protein